MEKNFKAAVKKYLKFCAAEGKKPDRPFKGSFNVRLPPALHQRAALYAEEHDQKFNSVVHDALKEFLARTG